MGVTRTLFLQLAAGLIVLCLLAPYFCFIRFSVARMVHRHQMWEKAEHALEQTIVLDSASVVWEKKGKEIRLNGEFFDVTSIRYEHGKAILAGVYDYAEKELVRTFEKEQEKNREPLGFASNLNKTWNLGFVETFVTIRLGFEMPLVITGDSEPAGKIHHLKTKPPSPPPRVT